MYIYIFIYKYDTCAWTPNNIKGSLRRAHLSTGASGEPPVDNECFSELQARQV